MPIIHNLRHCERKRGNPEFQSSHIDWIATLALAMTIREALI